MEYRVEQKYLVTEEQIAYLKKRLECVMEYDAHSGPEGYLIRSLYFDDLYDSCLWENENGVDHREKYRIRFYDNDRSLLHLECKEKEHGYTKKRSETIEEEECLTFMRGECPSLTKSAKDVRKKLYVKYLKSRMKPVNIVEYERVAMVEPAGNVRITFDRNIGGCNCPENFFDPILPTVPVLPTGQHILEVKYDEFLPKAIHDILKECSITRTAFSKYYLTRKALQWN